MLLPHLITFKLQANQLFLMRTFLLICASLLASLNAHAQKIHVQENFNTSQLPAAWNDSIISGNANWSFGIDASALEAGNNNFDNTSLAFFDDDALGGSAPFSTAHLYTPVFDNSLDSATYVQFIYNYRTDANVSGFFEVDVFDGSNWVNVFSKTSKDCGAWLGGACQQGYPRAKIDISSFRNTNCQIRFVFDDGDDWDYYVGIDDVVIFSPYHYDLKADYLQSPISECGLSTTDTIVGQFKNFGALDLDSFRIGYQVNSSPISWDTINTSLAPGDSISHAFNQTANLGLVQTYQIKLIADYFGELDRSNDTVTTQVTSLLVYSLPFFDDFEDTAIVWSFGGTRSTWERGLPSGLFIDTTWSGINCLVTNLSGDYNNNENSYIESPCFDFSQDTIDPVLSYYTIYHIEKRFDWLRWQYSLDKGKSWQNLNRGAIASNWGNLGDSTDNDIDGNSQKWIRVQNRLDNFAGQSAVKFRLVFLSDGSRQYEGATIDDLRLYTPSNDLSIDSINDFNRYECGFSDSMIFTAYLSNWSPDTIRSFRINYLVNNSLLVTDSVNRIIPPFTKFPYQFTNSSNLSQVGEYEIDFWVNVNGDSNNDNDSIKDLRHIQRKDYKSGHVQTPFYEDFDNLTAPDVGFRWKTTLGSNYKWETHQGSTYLGSNSGPNRDHTTSNGLYLTAIPQINNVIDSSIIESSCIALDNFKNPVLTYWLHLFGANFRNFSLDIFNGRSWVRDVERFTSQIQINSSDPYSKRIIDLSLMEGESIKLRFRTTKYSFRSVPAIDDISIFEGNLLNEISAGTPCVQSSKIPVKVFIENFNTDSIPADSLYLSYIVNSQATFLDTVSSSISFADTLWFTFSDSLDLSLYQNPITIDVVARYNNSIVDSLIDFEIQNSLIGRYLNEDFEKLELGVNPSVEGWEFDDSWELVDDRNISNSQIPSQDATIGGNKYILSEYKITPLNQDAQRVFFTTMPCISIDQNDTLSLKFKYHILGDHRNTLFIGLWNNGILTSIIDSVSGGSNLDEWRSKTVDLSVYSGQNIELGFAFNGRTDSLSNAIALDDIQILDQSQLLDVKLFDNKVVVSDCDYQNGRVALTIENNGGVNIPGGSITANYQLNSSAIVSNVVNTPLPANQSIIYTFAPDPSLGQASTQFELKSWVNHPSDTISINDTINELVFNNFTLADSLFEDFDDFVDGNCQNSVGDILKNGWISDSSTWAVQNGFSCNGTPTVLSGPNGDHGTGSGNFIYVQGNANDTIMASLTSPCIDLNNNANPYLVFWYHMYGIDINTLYVEGNANGNWQILDSISGQQQNSSSESWIADTIHLMSFLSNPVFKLRFRTEVTGENSNVALDDIEMYGLSFNTSIEEEKEQRIDDEVLIYPNPNNGEFKFSIPESLIGQTAQIFDLNGKLILHLQLKNELNYVSLPNSIAGLYIFRILESNVQRKFIIE
ncbi:MAG: hypothetical protein CMP59_09880 [Flavobacteriales bacterium]|nr:hypothetical protein [Flavobacteriales bacterium]